MFSIREKKVVE